MSNLNRRGDAKVVLIILACVGAAGVLACGVLIALLLPAVQSARTAARTAQARNNLKSIGLATHNYHDVYLRFPDSGAPASKKPGQSWQVSLLPFVEQINLYESLPASSQWDAPERHPALQTVVQVYLNPNVEGQETLTNGFGASHYAGSSQFYTTEALRVRDITGGTSNAIMAGEVKGSFRSWGDPGNLRDPADGFGDGPNQYGSPSGRGVTAMMMADGSVRMIQEGIDPEVLKQLADPTSSPPGGF